MCTCMCVMCACACMPQYISRGLSFLLLPYDSYIKLKWSGPSENTFTCQAILLAAGKLFNNDVISFLDTYLLSYFAFLQLPLKWLELLLFLLFLKTVLWLFPVFFFFKQLNGITVSDIAPSVTIWGSTTHAPIFFNISSVYRDSYFNEVANNST